MIRTVFSLLVILGGVAAIALFAAPQYQQARSLSAESAALDNALANAAKLRAVREDLEVRRNALSEDDLEKIETILPSYIDNVQLSAIDINNLAGQYRLVLKDVNTIEPEIVSLNPEEQANPIGKIRIELSFSGLYENFVAFLDHLEKSLRIMDVESLSFSVDTNNTEVDGLGYYTYDLVLTTYWLRSPEVSQVSVQ